MCALKVSPDQLLAAIQVHREKKLRRKEKEKRYKNISLKSLRKIAIKDELAEKILCERSFVDFFRLAWSSIDPSKYLHNWHIDAVCMHLQAAFEGKIQRLIINIPFRCAKSIICCVAFPAWVWVNSPEKRFLSASHSFKFSVRDNLKCRRLIESKFYQKHWGSNFKLTGDQNTKIVFENSKFGCKSATSVTAGTTGDGGDIIMIDDPSDAKAILSKVKAEGVIEWFDGTMTSRANNANDAIWLLIMQRLSTKDLTGHLLEQGGWEHLCIPMEYEGNKNKTSIGWEDPRTIMGELMWPEKFNEKEIKRLKKQLGYRYPGQAQQRPVALEGGYIKLGSLKYYKELPYVKWWCWSWDMAVKTGQHNDYSVGQLWAECENGHYLVYCFREKVEYPVLRQQVKILYEKYRSSEVLIEDKSSGEPLIQELRRSTSLPIISMVPGRDMPSSKEERVIMTSPLFEAGKIFVPENQPWVADIIEEWVTFPKAPHDDTVDAMSQYLTRKLSRSNSPSKLVIIN